MKENRKLMLPIAGRVQHGEQIISNNGKKQVKEYGYFIAKIQEKEMQTYLDKFNSLIKGKNSIDIKLLENDTFTKKRVRYNQSGPVCYCMDNEETGKIKDKKIWKDINCNSNCQYLQKDEYGKSLCNRIAWLKFFIPEITTDRIWLMKITGQKSIDNIDSYLQMQKIQGNSLNNIYTLFLTQKEQTNSFGKTFNNYVLDIVKKENFISSNQITQINQEQNQKQDDLSTKCNKNVNNSTQKESQKEVTKKKPKQTQTKTIQSKQTQEEVKQPKQENREQEDANLDNCYLFDSLSSETIATKDGKKEYIVGKFYNMNDQIQNLIIPNNLAEELQKCELGTYIQIKNIKTVGERKFALDYKFIEKLTKKEAA